MYGFLCLYRTSSCDHTDSFCEQHIPPSFQEGFIAWEGLIRFIHGRAWSQCAELGTLKTQQSPALVRQQTLRFPFLCMYMCFATFFIAYKKYLFFSSFYCMLEEEEQTVPAFLTGFPSLDLKFQSPFRRTEPEQSLSLLRKTEKGEAKYYSLQQHCGERNISGLGQKTAPSYHIFLLTGNTTRPQDTKCVLASLALHSSQAGDPLSPSLSLVDLSLV